MSTTSFTESRQFYKNHKSSRHCAVFQRQANIFCRPYSYIPKERKMDQRLLRVGVNVKSCWHIISTLPPKRGNRWSTFLS